MDNLHLESKCSEIISIITFIGILITKFRLYVYIYALLKKTVS